MRRPRLFVTLEGYAVEGGFDCAHGPQTCFAPTIALNRHRGPEVADDLWRNYERVLDFVPGLGVDGVRLNLEWARLAPRRGVLDEVAVERYRQVLVHLRRLDLAVTVVLVDAAWPSWLGLEAWLLPWVVPEVLAHARRVVATYGDLFDALLPFTRVEDLVAGGYLRASSPPWRRSAIEDANFAHAQIELLQRTLAEDPVVGARLVTSSVEVNLDEGAGAVIAARALDVDEIHLRSLLRGSGPSAAPAGLLVQHGVEWCVHVEEELRRAFA